MQKFVWANLHVKQEYKRKKGTVSSLLFKNDCWIVDDDHHLDDDKDAKNRAPKGGACGVCVTLAPALLLEPNI